MAFDYAFIAVDEARVTRFVRLACLGEASHARDLAAAVADRFNVWGPATHFKQAAAQAWPHDEARFDHFFYLWGRPYFVLDREPEQVSQAIRALFERPGQARSAELYLEQARRFRPGAEDAFAELARRPWLDETPDDRLPYVQAQLDELAPIHAALAAQPPSMRLHGSVEGLGGRKFTPTEFAQLLAFRTAEFCSITGPFWLCRGASLGDLLDLGDLAASPLFLFGRVEGFERRLLQLFPSQITEQRSTGVYVRHKDLDRVAELLYLPPQELKARAPSGERLELAQVRRLARLLREVVHHCRAAGLGLWEVEGVCVPFEGDWP